MSLITIFLSMKKLIPSLDCDLRIPAAHELKNKHTLKRNKTEISQINGSHRFNAPGVPCFLVSQLTVLECNSVPTFQKGETA